MKYFPGIPVPTYYAKRIQAFGHKIAQWALRGQSSEPHISVKGSAGLDDNPGMFAVIEQIAAMTVPVGIRLRGPVIFEGEPVLHLGVDSPGWSRLNRRLIHTIALKNGAEMHPLEIIGRIPHLTIIRLKPELLSHSPEIRSATAHALSPYPTFTAHTVRMYRQDVDEGQPLPFRDFDLSG